MPILFPKYRPDLNPKSTTSAWQKQRVHCEKEVHANLHAQKCFRIDSQTSSPHTSATFICDIYKALISKKFIKQFA